MKTVNTIIVICCVLLCAAKAAGNNRERKQEYDRRNKFKINKKRSNAPSRSNEVVLNPSPIYDIALCGNEIVDPGEGCDDGNQRNGDGCSYHCFIEPEFDCKSHQNKAFSECWSCFGSPKYLLTQAVEKSLPLNAFKSSGVGVRALMDLENGELFDLCDANNQFMAESKRGVFIGANGQRVGPAKLKPLQRRRLLMDGFPITEERIEKEHVCLFSHFATLKHFQTKMQDRCGSHFPEALWSTSKKTNVTQWRVSFEHMEKMVKRQKEEEEKLAQARAEAKAKFERKVKAEEASQPQ